MTFKQFIIIPLFIAVLATFLMVLEVYKGAVLPHFEAWIAFQAWAMYFMAGCTYKGGVKVLLGYLGGAIASVAIFELMGLLLLCGLPQSVSLWIAVLIVVVPVICAERIPWFDFVPAWFVGAGVFFGIMALKQNWIPGMGEWATFVAKGTNLTVWAPGMSKWAKYLAAGTHLMVSCAVGMVFGVVTIAIRTKYEAMLKAKQPAAADDAPAKEE